MQINDTDEHHLARLALNLCILSQNDHKTVASILNNINRDIACDYESVKGFHLK